jgi:hypothetical protein
VESVPSPVTSAARRWVAVNVRVPAMACSTQAASSAETAAPAPPDRRGEICSETPSAAANA